MSQNQNGTGMKKTLGLMGVTMNAMALIAPGAFIWISYQVQAAQTDAFGVSTASDIWFGLLFATIISFLTAVSYSLLSKRYPDAGTGSSYTFAVRSFLDRGASKGAARAGKFTLGWISHLYYWVYPGVMVAFMAVFIGFILQTFGIAVSPLVQVGVAITFAAITGYIAFRGITTSTLVNVVINVVQWVMIIGITVLALMYRFLNPEQVAFVFPSLGDIVLPHDFTHVLFQASIAILVLVGFETATALNAEAKNPRDVTRGVMISLVIQGLIFYVIGYFGVQAWINNSYAINGQTGFAAAALSAAPIGDMTRNLGNVFLGGHGFELMLVVAISVAAAVLGTTLACTNTGVRLSYAMGLEGELPKAFGKLHEKRRTPHIGVLVLTIVSAIIGAWGSLSIANLTAVTILSNIGTFLLYGLTNAVAFFAFRKTPGSRVIHRVIPNLGAAANIAMLLAIVGLGIVGGGIAQFAAVFGLVATAIWMVIGVSYFVTNSRTQPSSLLPFRGKAPSLESVAPVGESN